MSDENDITTQLANEFKNMGTNFLVEYAAFDADFGVPPGTTKTHIESAANDAGMEIVRKGNTQARLRKMQHKWRWFGV